MKETIKKNHNYYWIWDYGSVVPFTLNYQDDDGEFLKKPQKIIKSHISKEELEEYIEVLKYALSKRKKWEEKNLTKHNSSSKKDCWNNCCGAYKEFRCQANLDIYNKCELKGSPS